MPEPTTAPPRRLGALKIVQPSSPPRSRLQQLSTELQQQEEPAVRAMFALRSDEILVKTTITLCPTCLQHAPAAVVRRDGRVYLRRVCAQHGPQESLVENDERYYFVSNKDRSGRVFDQSRVFDIPTFALPGQDDGACCGPGESCDTPSPLAEALGDGPADQTGQMGNKTCTILVEVTNACNLACTVCYSDAKGDRVVPADQLIAHLDALAKQKGGLDSVQLTGGEALLHPQFWEILAALVDHPLVKKVYLPTNGLLVAKPEIATRLATYKHKLMVLLQFDGVRDATDRAMRDATPQRQRRRAIENLGELGVFMQLTMTLSAGINDDEVGDVIDLALRYEHVKVVALQPATYSGRYDLPPDPLHRLTMSDVIKAVTRQAGARVAERDFVPIPCSHPNCGWITLFLRRFGIVHNIVRYVDLPKVVDQVSYRTLLSTDELRRAVGQQDGFSLKRAIASLGKKLVRSQDMFTVAVKPFMDRFTYDQDRIANCCHHLMDTRGVPTSFCEYNARLRQADGWERFPTL